MFRVFSTPWRLRFGMPPCRQRPFCACRHLSFEYHIWDGHTLTFLSLQMASDELLTSSLAWQRLWRCIRSSFSRLKHLRQIWFGNPSKKSVLLCFTAAVLLKQSWLSNQFSTCTFVFWMNQNRQSPQQIQRLQHGYLWTFRSLLSGSKSWSSKHLDLLEQFHGC